MVMYFREILLYGLAALAFDGLNSCSPPMGSIIIFCRDRIFVEKRLSMLLICCIDVDVAYL